MASDSRLKEQLPRLPDAIVASYQACCCRLCNLGFESFFYRSIIDEKLENSTRYSIWLQRIARLTP